jgi:predicted kinase
MALVLLSGRPGTGKTAFANWLAAERGFTHVDTDSDRSALQLLAGVQSAEAAAAARNWAQDLGSNVVVEWGFKLAYLDRVRLLRDAGFDAWWLDGDEPAARQGYISRHGDSAPAMDAYWRQVQQIEAAWPELQRFFGDHIVRAVTCAPVYKAFADVVSIMVPDVEG